MEQLKAEVAELKGQIARQHDEYKALEQKIESSFNDLRTDVQELLSLFRASKGFVRISRALGKLVMWVGGLAAAAAAMMKLGGPAR